MTEDWELAEVLYNARIKAAWGKHASARMKFPDWRDPKVLRAYPHFPVADVDLALAGARAVNLFLGRAR